MVNRCDSVKTLQADRFIVEQKSATDASRERRESSNGSYQKERETESSNGIEGIALLERVRF